MLKKTDAFEIYFNDFVTFHNGWIEKREGRANRNDETTVRRRRIEELERRNAESQKTIMGLKVKLQSRIRK